MHEVVFYEFYAFIFVREGDEQENKNRIKSFIQQTEDMGLSTQVLTLNPGKQTNLHFGAIALDKDGIIVSILTSGSW